MTDKELLELAAKAAGMPVIDSGGLGLRISSDGCKAGYMWNPLTDDGDALRLAVKLGLTISPTGNLDFVFACVSTRRAIVRAAAEIGKEMK